MLNDSKLSTFVCFVFVIQGISLVIFYVLDEIAELAKFWLINLCIELL